MNAHGTTRTRWMSILAAIVSTALGAGGPAGAVLPGLWSLPAPVLFNGFVWAPAPAGGTGSTLPGGETAPNILALRLQAPVETVPMVGGVIGFGNVNVTMPTGIEVDDISQLQFDAHFESGVACGGGSPRFQLRVDLNDSGLSDAADKNVFVYAGSYPNFNNCATGAWTHHDLIAVPPEELRWDSTQLGGPFYGSQASATTAAAGHDVLSVALVWDSWWQGTGDSVLWIDNIQVNDFLLGEPGLGHACSLATGQGQNICS